MTKTMSEDVRTFSTIGHFILRTSLFRSFLTPTPQLNVETGGNTCFNYVQIITNNRSCQILSNPNLRLSSNIYCIRYRNLDRDRDRDRKKSRRRTRSRSRARGDDRHQHAHAACRAHLPRLRRGDGRDDLLQSAARAVHEGRAHLQWQHQGLTCLADAAEISRMTVAVMGSSTD